MKIIKEEPIQAHIQKTEVIICDRCQKIMRVKTCPICGKDVCWKCAVQIESIYDSDLRTPNFHSDYPDYVCKKCWDMGIIFRERITSLHDAKEKEVECLIEQWSEYVKGK
jgi:hypothetical protein